VAASPEQIFTEKLEVFRQEGYQCAQFLYEYLTIHAAAARDENIRHVLNRNALFWNTTLAALQTSTLIALGRIFDHKSRHGIRALLDLARNHAAIFSKAALSQRKAGIFANDPKGLQDYLNQSYEPDDAEFRRLERLVHAATERYNSAYRSLRNQVFAHKVHGEAEKIHDLFSQTNVSKLEQLVTFLVRFHWALQEALTNGSRLVLHRTRHSVNEMLEQPPGRARVKPVQEMTVIESHAVLKAAAEAASRELAAARLPRGPRIPERPVGKSS
jgi:hypothetical protein